MLYKNIRQLKTALETKKENYWEKKGQETALALFYEAAKYVPAYKDFLNKNKVNPREIKTIEDFKKIPAITKNNYLKVYPLEELCWNGELGKTDMISVSSGSSGEPFYWFRGKEQEDETALSHELFLVDSFGIDKQSTLFIVSFSMGMWVAGTLTYRAVQKIAEKYGMTVITPGINIGDILNIIKKLGGKYGQIIIAGYPPFIKDIVDSGETNGIDWKKYRIKFLFAAEAFSENWRNYLYDKIGSEDSLKDSLNIYGTADALILGHETPLSIKIRREASKNENVFRKLFSDNIRVPTLVQYNPVLRYFEQVNKNLIFTARSGIPLVRYDIGDEGKLLSFDNINNIFLERRIDLTREAKKEKISVWQLPFLYVLGRDDLTATLYGINIYPETIRDAVNLGGINNFVSGKFTMVTKNDPDFNQYLEINVELKNEQNAYPAGLTSKIKETIVRMLKNKSKEYNELYKALGRKAEPEIRLCSYGDKRFFTPGLKQKWHRKA